MGWMPLASNGGLTLGKFGKGSDKYGTLSWFIIIKNDKEPVELSGIEFG